jgi:mitochondrial intermediate peptidase
VSVVCRPTPLLSFTPGNSKIEAWDWQYYASKHKTVEMPDLPLYFPLRGVLKGLQSIVHAVFGVEMSMESVPPSEAWSSPDSLLKCEFRDGPTRLGVVYLDLLGRPNKHQGAAHFVVRCGRAVHSFEVTDVSPDKDTVIHVNNGERRLYQLPIVTLVTSFTSGEQTPTVNSTLLTHNHVETLFHEFGHALHSMLSRTEFQHLSGTRGTLDFMEFPSHFLETFAWDARVLSSFARHAHTGSTIPAEYIRQLQQSSAQFAGINLQSQVVQAMFDQVLHGARVPGLVLPQSATPSQILQEVYAKYSSLPFIPNTNWECGFSHLASYGAGYYSYLCVCWCGLCCSVGWTCCNGLLVVGFVIAGPRFAQLYAAVVWDVFFSEDPLHGGGGRTIRTAVLEKGGSKDPAAILRDLLGTNARAVDASVLVRAKKNVV